MTYAQMPPEAADVMRTIRYWQRKTGEAPRLRTLRCVCKGHPEATRRGLSWLKQKRLVMWTNEGSGTRYAAKE